MATDRTLTPLGYAWLRREFTLNPIPHFVESYAADPGTRITERTADRVREIYPHTAHRLNAQHTILHPSRPSNSQNYTSNMTILGQTTFYRSQCVALETE